METKKKWPQVGKYKWSHNVVLTRHEGEILDAIIAQHNCANISQLCKRIVRGELEIKPKERAD